MVIEGKRHTEVNKQQVGEFDTFLRSFLAVHILYKTKCWWPVNPAAGFISGGVCRIDEEVKYVTDKKHCPIVAWGRSQQQMINTVNSLLTVKCHSCLYVNTRHKQKRTRSRVSSCFSHSTETGVIASTCTCRLHLSHTNRHRAKTKKKKQWHV